MFAKIFQTIYDGTLGTKGPWQALVTFQQMLILADRSGVVDMTPEAISRRTTIPLDIIRVGITELEKPDAASRLPNQQGRRIVRLASHRAWGWSIVNYDHYHKLRSVEDRKEYFREKQRESRARRRLGADLDAPPTPARTPDVKPVKDVKEITHGTGLNKTVGTKGSSVPKVKDSLKGSSSASASDANAKRTWLSPVADVWHQRFGPDTFPFKQHARALAALYRRGEPPIEVARRLGNYLDSLSGPQYLSVPKFVQTYGRWDKARTNGKGAPERGRGALLEWVRE